MISKLAHHCLLVAGALLSLSLVVQAQDPPAPVDIPTLATVDVTGTIVQVPFKMCRRLTNIQKLDGWVTLEGLDSVDIGRCGGGCLGTTLTGKKECQPTKTSAVTVMTTVRPMRQKQIEVVRECGCVCCNNHVCPDGFFWDAQSCQCFPKVEPKPCQRFSEYNSVFGTMVDVGMCRGECDSVYEACKTVVYGSQVVAANGALAQVQTVGKCGCSDCAVKPQWIVVQQADGSLIKVNVGMCSGTCGPQMWPTDTSDLSQYWTTACVRAETAPLYVSNTMVLEQVTKCDCKPVKPRCQRIPKYVLFWNADGEQRLDVGACEGQCGATGTACKPTIKEQVICNGVEVDPATGASTSTNCITYEIVVECGC